MPVPCDASQKVVAQTLFLGASVADFSTNLGWGSQASTLNVSLVRDISYDSTGYNRPNSTDCMFGHQFPNGAPADGNGNDGDIEWFTGLSQYGLGITQGTDAIRLRRDNAEFMRIDSSGRLLVGSTSANTLAGGVQSHTAGVVGTTTTLDLYSRAHTDRFP